MFENPLILPFVNVMELQTGSFLLNVTVGITAGTEIRPRNGEDIDHDPVASMMLTKSALFRFLSEANMKGRQIQKTSTLKRSARFI